jgi:hypothetical protein
MRHIYLLSCIFLLFNLHSRSQEQAPAWYVKDFRVENYPYDEYLVGYMEGGLIGNETLEEATERLKKMAQSELIETVLVQIQSYTESSVQDISLQSDSRVVQFYEASVKTESNMEITGLVTETYYNPESKTISAFAYANRFEIIGYYKANIFFNLQQINQILTNSNQLFEIGEKFKAKNELEKTIPLFAKVDYSYGLLIALKGNIDTLQFANTLKLRTEIMQKLARLEKGVFVLIRSQEDIFGTTSDLLSNALKRDIKGCTFTTDDTIADWLININASAREYSFSGGFYFSYVDVIASLTRTKTNQLIYQEEFSQKGGSSDYKKAARKAMEEAGSVLSGKINAEINK